MKRLVKIILIGITASLLISSVIASSEVEQVSATDFSSIPAIEQRLAQVRADLEHPGPGDAGGEFGTLLRELEIALVQHREALDYLKQVREQRADILETARNWKGLPGRPPYSIQFADGLRAEHDAVERRLDGSDSRLRIIADTIEDANTRLTERERAVRRLNEAARLAETSQSRHETARAARAETLHARIAAENVARLRLRQQAEEVRHAALETALDLAGLRLTAVNGKVEFTRAERDRIDQQLDTRRNRLLEAATADGATRGDRQITWKLEILDIERAFWSAAYEAFNAGDDRTEDQARAKLRRLQDRIDDWVEMVRLQVREDVAEGAPALGAAISETEARGVIELQQKIRYTRDLLGDAGVSVPGLLGHAANGLLAVWGMELYLAKETASIGGEKITNYSPVTLGKILRLALILAVGWFVLRFLARRLHRLMLRRQDADPGKADMIRNWTFGIGLTLLVLYGLNRVHIPFTAFAFLGGTLAIGIGFGAQTLLKNFISGVILSLERPFKVGDLVEVDAIMGNIIHIGLRASVIRHFDGTDTLVPNSSLLENRVSNWTFNDNAMRDSIEIGVAYGSSAHVVKHTLLSVAESHGLVLDSPPPSVQLKEFGDNALKFSLLYWFDALRVRAPVIASDLHFMVDRAFREAGIEIAFPQRDVHFDAKPLKIELTRPKIDGK